MSKKVLIEFNGKIASIAEHCRDLGVKPQIVINRRYKTGESYEKCLEYYQENGIKFTKIEFNGKLAYVAEHCRDIGVNEKTVYSRQHRTGETILECLEYYQENGVNSGIRHRHRHSRKIKDMRLYRKWYSTKQKCENPKHIAYPRYGAKGIKVCERWQVYENFEKDMLESFLEHVEQYGIKDTTLDRFPDKMGDYEPNNIRWATMKEQQNNRTNNRMITEDLTVAQFAEKYNIPYSTVLARLNKGWSVEEILNTVR